jgi:hypothetical protein
MADNCTTELSATLEGALAVPYPGLVVTRNGEGALIEGTVDLHHNNVSFGSFLVTIQVDHDYPETQPVCREIGGRIPRNPDHHTNGNGTLCLGVPEEIWMRMNGVFEIKAFIDTCLVPFLIGAACKLSGGTWPHGERGHGAVGIVEFYAERFGTHDPSRVLDVIAMLSEPVVRGHWPCPCGSGEVLRRCHRTAVLEMRAQGLPSTLLGSSAIHVLKLVQATTDLQAAELRKLAMTMKRIDKNLKAA